ncbi:MAG: hypothetical protein KGL10_08455 [Alphaproteobacteria bacterium]|nr:hypothetical protein [Alphaproteobacteria bacterium]
MPANSQKIKYVFNFPQGLVLLMDGGGSPDSVGGIYFKPHQGNDAFMVYGERKELFGKHAVTVAKNRDTGAGGYSLVYEFFWNNAPADIRLVKDKTTVTGVAVEQDAVRRMSDDIAAGKTVLHDVRDMQPDRVFNVARFADGRLLIQLLNRNELYLGTPGNYEKVDAKCVLQGGCSMYYQTPAGERIDLPYGMGGPLQNDSPKFKGEKLEYIDVKSDGNPAEFGLELASKIVPLDPFSPQLEEKKSPPSAKNAFPKPPGL